MMMRIRKFSAFCIISFIFFCYFNVLNRTSRHNLDSELQSIKDALAHLSAVDEEMNQSINQIAEPNLQIVKSTNLSTLDVDHNQNKSNKSVSKTFSCSIRKHSTPDVQMSSMYERIVYDNNSDIGHRVWHVPYKRSQKNKLKVFIIPYSHFDVGWLTTYNSCYMLKIRAIFKNMLEKLWERPGRKFIWTEANYLHLWWKDPITTSDQKLKLQTLLKSGQLEIVTGGWVLNNEVNRHWISIIQQLTTGHQWLLDHLNYIPKNSWQIDSYSHSSNQAYLNKLAGFDNALIQMVHIRIKKELASSCQLEFKWRQLWNDDSATDMFTHLTPFNSYDVPDSCGPNPKICCQFDFKRLLNNSTMATCPWGVAPKKIVPDNVHERASLILKQWREKSQLYLSNVVMFPLGDDGRYVDADEWDAQYQNYEMIIDYINNTTEFNAEVQFGTLQDYFDAVHAEVKMSDFPVLSGDFFPYADRSQHSWSGYFITRPFYKYLDRVLLAYIRAAESITALAVTSQSVTSLQLHYTVEEARRALALFQHHDGEDFAMNLLPAIISSQSVIQRAAYLLLQKPALSNHKQDIFFTVEEVWRRHDKIPMRATINLCPQQPAKNLVLYNALAFTRYEVFTVYVSTPHVQVRDNEGNVMRAQVSPLMPGPRKLRFAENKYQLSFLVTVKPLSIAVYTVSLRNNTDDTHTYYASVRIYNAKEKKTTKLPKKFAVHMFNLKNLKSNITIRAGTSSAVVVTKHGLIKALVSRNKTTTPVNMEFVKYENCTNSSKVLAFIPTKPAEGFQPKSLPQLVVVEGIYKSTLYTMLAEQKKAEVMMAISVYDNPSLRHTAVEIINTLRIDEKADDFVLAMRFSTAVKNGDVFYTDQDGMRMTKRRYFEKLPLQENYYPLSGAAYIEDDTTRFTLLSFTPLAVSALAPGTIEVMQDVRLRTGKNQPDNNVRTRHTFRLLVEHANKHCQFRLPDHPIGQLSLGAHVSQQQLLQPMISMQYSPSDDSAPHYSSSLSSAADIVLASYRAHVSAKDEDGKILHGLGMTFQRVHLDPCFGNKAISKWYPVGDGQACTHCLPSVDKRTASSVVRYVGDSSERVDEFLSLCGVLHLKKGVNVSALAPDAVILSSSLTHVRARAALAGGALRLCGGDVRSVLVRTR